MTAVPALAAVSQKPLSTEPRIGRDPQPLPEIDLSAIAPIDTDAPSPDTDSIGTPPVEPMSAGDLALKTQIELNRLGCRAGAEDGIWGRKSRDAMARLATHAKTLEIAALEPTELLLREMESLRGGICPLVCDATENLIDGACIRKTCAKGQRLAASGQCYTPQVARTPPKVHEEIRFQLLFI